MLRNLHCGLNRDQLLCTLSQNQPVESSSNMTIEFLMCGYKSWTPTEEEERKKYQKDKGLAEDSCSYESWKLERAALRQLYKRHTLDPSQSSQSRLSIPGFHENTTKKRFGARSFKCSAPALWNALPSSLKSSTSTESFRSHLKTYLFSKF
nr:hypothetical protein BaRGS_027957 [Batillaria attramentaria]